MTAPVFRDIADTVQDGLHRLGHPSTIIYCTNIAFDNCVGNRRRLIVLAAHNLASFVTADGRSGVLEKNILPPGAGEALICLASRSVEFIPPPGFCPIREISVPLMKHWSNQKRAVFPISYQPWKCGTCYPIENPDSFVTCCDTDNLLVEPAPPLIFLNICVRLRMHLFSLSVAVLYNFEQIPRKLPRALSETSVGQSEGRDRSLINASTLEIYARYTIWDYSEENVRRLVAMGIHAELVPLGYSSKLRPTERVRQNGEDEEIDVLFIGMETPTRQATIRRLRDTGITVAHPNSAGTGLFGAEFDAISARSKIVLNLNAFGKTEDDCSSSSDALCNQGEWKMPRLARLLANGRWVVAIFRPNLTKSL